MSEKDTAELSLDETNELFFKIKVHGAERSPIIARLVCEIGNISYCFRGTTTDDMDVVRFEVPPLKHSVKSGQLCEARIEVIVDDHYFVPIKFDAEFKEPMNVVAESVSHISTKKTESTIQVQANSISKSKYSSLRDKFAKTKLAK